MKTLGELTLQELEALIDRAVEHRLERGLRFQHLLGRPHDPRTVQEVLDSVERHRWTPPPGSPSVVEMLREDRDR